MAALPDFGDISIIPQEHSAVYEETLRPDHEDTTTVEETQDEESQSQSLLRDMVVAETDSQSQSQSQSLLHDMEHVETVPEPEPLPMEQEEEQSPGSDPIAEDVNNEDDDFIEEIDLEQEDEEESDPIPEGDIEDITEQSEDVVILENTDDIESVASDKIFHLPLSKVKRIMKTDEDTNLISKEALVAVSVCTELFVSLIAQHSYKIAAASKKKTVGIQHVKTTLTSSPIFDFLEGALPEFEI